MSAEQAPKPKESHYSRLGVEKHAGEAEIKAAFRKLAMEHHPDKETGSTERFQEINESFQTLNDPGKRAAYDAEERRKEVLERLRTGSSPEGSIAVDGGEYFIVSAAGEKLSDGYTYIRRQNGITFGNKEGDYYLLDPQTGKQLSGAYLWIERRGMKIYGRDAGGEHEIATISYS